MLNKLKIVFLAILVSLFLFWAIISLFFSSSFYGLNENFFYWIELAALIYARWTLKLRSGFFLYTGLVLILFGAVLNIFGFEFAEQIFRISIDFWIVGIFLSMKELKQ